MNNNTKVCILVGVLVTALIIVMCACSKSKNARAPAVNQLTAIPPVNTVCNALLHGYRNFTNFHDRENFTPSYKAQVAESGCSWRPFEDVRCENMPAQDGIRSGCDPSYYSKRCAVYQDYVRLVSGSDIKPFIYPIERLINSECDSNFNPYA